MDDVSRFEQVLVPEPTMLDPEQQSIVDELKAEGKAITWTNEVNLLEHIEPVVSLESDSSVWLLPRKNPQQLDAPVVVHMINHSYDESTNTIAPQSNVSVRFRPELFGDKNVSGVTLFAAGGKKSEVSFETSQDGILVVVSELNLWSILEVEVE